MNARRGRRESGARRRRESGAYHVVDGPGGRLSLAEAAVGEVPGGEGDVLAGAGKQQPRAVDDDQVIVPVLVALPAAALHLQTETDGL